MFDLFIAQTVQTEYNQELQQYLEAREINRQELIRLYTEDYNNLEEIDRQTKAYLEHSEQTAYYSYIIAMLTRLISNLTR